jgi:hypothetical protein
MSLHYWIKAKSSTFEPVNHNIESTSGSGIFRKKAQNTQSVDVSPFASPLRFFVDNSLALGFHR